MRRRSTSRSDEGLDEPLLGGEHAGSAPPRAAPSPPPPSAVIPWAAPAAFFLKLWEFLHLEDLWRAFASLLGPLLPRPLRPRPRPSPRTLAAHARLVSSLAEAFDPASSAHAAALADLWTASFPDRPHPASGVVPNPAWRDAGWQGDDPRTDVRGGGIAAVRAALTMASTEPALWTRLRHKDRGPGGYLADMEYPFGAGGVAVTVLTAQAAGLLGGRGAVALPVAPGPPTSAGGRGFVTLLESLLGEGEATGDDDATAWAAFAGLYCAAFERLDDAWVSASASYMAFPSIASSTREELEAALARGPASVGAVRARLGLS